MEMQPLFSTVEREKIMRYLLENPSTEINMNAMARRLCLSPGQIHKYVSLLRGNGLVEGKWLRDTPLVRALRLIDNLRRIDDARLVRLARRYLTGVKGIAVYGSWATGSNLETADLDIWVKMAKEPKDAELAALRRKLGEAIGAPVDILIATPGRLEHLKSKNESLFHSLYHSIVLWGEGI